MRPRRNQQPNDPYTKDAADPLELIARMNGRTSYRVPVEGRGSTVLLTANDIAAAVGMMRDSFARETALSVVRRGGARDAARLARVAQYAVARAIRAQRPPPLDLRRPADRWRLNIVTYDAAMQLVRPECVEPFGVLAKSAKMRKASYIAVHRIATAVFEDALGRARSDFRRRLKGDACPVNPIGERK